MAAKKTGRRKGGKAKGYFFRAGRGWIALEGTKQTTLRDGQGNKLTVRNTPADVLADAYARYCAERDAEAAKRASGDATPVIEVCRQYLDHCQKENRANTYDTRSRLLYDFCTGFPPAFRDKEKAGEPKPSDRIHKGYGALSACDLTHAHITEWCNAHKGWTTHRMPKQAVKRAFSWASSPDVGLLKSNPLAGLKIPVSKKRITYFDDAQEAALLKYSKPALAQFIRIAIRTGCRPGELRTLTAKHVEDTQQGQVWRFKADEHKTGKEKQRWRIVRVPQDIAAVIRELINKHPKGPLLRNTQGKPWNETSLRSVFARLVARCRKKGVEFDSEACCYTTRHTFAKRVLGGYWTGKPATIEQLCALMGNSRDVAWENYGQWCEAYDTPLWDAVG
jgi:integrase